MMSILQGLQICFLASEPGSSRTRSLSLQTGQSALAGRHLLHGAMSQSGKRALLQKGHHWPMTMPHTLSRAPFQQRKGQAASRALPQEYPSVNVICNVAISRARLMDKAE